MSSIDFGGTDGELEKYLVEFAARLRGGVARDRGTWVLSAGAWLSPNPNSIPFRLRVRRQEKSVVLEPTAVALPWTRAKVARLVAFRQGQLADYLVQRARGSAPESFDALRLREPFSAYGSGPAALCATYTWAVASGLAALGAALVAATLLFMPLMSLSLSGMAARAKILQDAGVHGIQGGGLLGAAFVFGFPIAVLGGLVHAFALAVADLGVRAARVPQSSALFLAVLVAVGLFPFFPFLSWPIGLAFPLLIHLGHTVVWGRRRERIREGPLPRRAVVAAGFVLAAGAAGLLAPRPVGLAEFNDRIALFRDRVLLGSPLGRAAARLYYRHTLAAADPLKEFFSLDERRSARAQRIAFCPRPEAAGLLRELDFTVVTAGDGDVEVLDRGLSKDGEVEPLPEPLDRAGLAKALDRLSGRTHRGGPLRDVCWLAWRAVYFGGPVAAVLVFIALSAPFASLLFRVMSPKGAFVTLVACVATTGFLMIAAESAAGRVHAGLDELRADPTPARVKDGLLSPSIAVRHEAAYRACRIKDVSGLADALLKAADDDDLRVRLWACAALGRTGDPRALDRLVARLDDREFFVRYRAAEGLGFLKDPRAVDPLVKRLKEAESYEALYALHALRRIAPERF